MNGYKMLLKVITLSFYALIFVEKESFAFLCIKNYLLWHRLQ